MILTASRCLEFRIITVLRVKLTSALHVYDRCSLVKRHNLLYQVCIKATLMELLSQYVLQ